MFSSTVMMAAGHGIVILLVQISSQQDTAGLISVVRGLAALQDRAAQELPG
jgi:hypothetical protein